MTVAPRIVEVLRFLVERPGYLREMRGGPVQAHQAAVAGGTKCYWV